MRGDAEDRFRSRKRRAKFNPCASENIVLDGIHRVAVPDKERGHSVGKGVSLCDCVAIVRSHVSGNEHCSANNPRAIPEYGWTNFDNLFQILEHIRTKGCERSIEEHNTRFSYSPADDEEVHI